MAISREDIEEALIESHLVYKDDKGNFCVGLNGDSDINWAVDAIVKALIEESL